MDRRERAMELSQSYLDQIATEGDLAQLERLLQEDPQAAAIFANAVRLDASLADHFGPVSTMLDMSAALRPHRPALRRWAAVAAAVLIVTSVALVLFFSSRAVNGPPGTAGYSVVSGRILVDGVESAVIRPGTRLSVAGPVAAVIELPDTSRTELDPASEAVIHGRRGNARQTVQLIKGGATFRVAAGRGRFCVDTPVGLITVLGTEFTVKLRPGGDTLKGASDMKARLAQVLAVAVIFGTVEVDIGGEKYVLLGGESRAFAADDRKEGEGERSKRHGRPFYAKFKAYDPSQKTLFVTYQREGTGHLEATWDVERDAEIIVDGKKGKLQDLVEGCSVKVWFADDARKHISALEAEGPSMGGRWGVRIAGVDAKKKTITLRTGERADQTKTYPVAKDAKIIINGEPGQLADVSADKRAWLRMSADMKTICYIRQGVSPKKEGEGERKREPRREGDREGEGRSSKRRGRTAYARFKAFDASQNTLFVKHKMGENFVDATWDIDRDSEIIVDGKKGKLTGLAEGCPLKVWFSDDARKRVSALEAEGPPVGGRGNRPVHSVDAKKSTITLRMGERKDNVKTYPVAKDAKIIIDGKDGKLADVSPGKNAYLRLSVDMKTICYIKQGTSRRKEGEGE